MLLRNTAEVGSPQREAISTQRTTTVPSKPGRGRRGTAHSSDDNLKAATSRSQGSGSSLAEQAAAAAALAAEMMSDEESDEGWSTSRPRGLSSTAETREVRRSSTSEMNVDEDRDRCLTGAAPDLSYDGKRGGGGDHVMRDDAGQGSRTNSGWKWDFASWHTGSKSAHGGAVKGRKRASKSPAKSV